MINKQILYYIGLSVTVFIAHYFSGFLEEMVVAGNQLAWAYLFIWYTLFLAAGDKILKYFKIQ